jgi:hypothetical protein
VTDELGRFCWLVFYALREGWGEGGLTVEGSSSRSILNGCLRANLICVVFWLGNAKTDRFRSVGGAQDTTGDHMMSKDFIHHTLSILRSAVVAHSLGAKQVSRTTSPTGQGFLSYRSALKSGSFVIGGRILANGRSEL